MRAPLALATLLVATLLANPLLAGEQTPRRVWIDSDPARTAEIFEWLDNSIGSAGFDFVDTPLEEVVAFLREEYAFEIQIDRPALDELGIGPEEPVSIEVRGVKLGPALRMMLHPLDLAYTVQDGVLLITTEEEAIASITLAAYSVEDLVDTDDSKATDAFHNGLYATVHPESWAENGGGVCEARFMPGGPVLMVSQTTLGHERVSAFLAALHAFSDDAQDHEEHNDD